MLSTADFLYIGNVIYTSMHLNSDSIYLSQVRFCDYFDQIPFCNCLFAKELNRMAYIYRVYSIVDFAHIGNVIYTTLLLNRNSWYLFQVWFCEDCNQIPFCNCLFAKQIYLIACIVTGVFYSHFLHIGNVIYTTWHLNSDLRYLFQVKCVSHCIIYIFVPTIEIYRCWRVRFLLSRIYLYI